MSHTHFVPHGYCLLWSWPLIAAIIFGDLMVALAYCGIPLELRRAAMKGIVALAPEARGMLRDFGMFILFCGGGHIIYLLLLWRPWYWFGAIWTLGTAFWSWRCLIRIHGGMELYAALLEEPFRLTLLLKRNQELTERLVDIERRIPRSNE